MVKGDDSCFFEAVHALSDLYLCKPFVVKVYFVLLFVEGLLMDKFAMYLHVLEVLHWSAKVKVFDVNAHVSGTFARL